MADFVKAFRLLLDADVKGAVDGLGKMGTAATGAESKLSVTDKAAAKFGLTSGQMGAVVTGAAIAGGAALAKFALDGAAKFGALGGAVEKFGVVAGTTNDVASRFVAVADDYGVSADQLAGAVGKLGKGLGANVGELDKYGVAVARTKDGQVDLAATTFNVIDAYNATADPTKKAALGTQAFGKSYQELIPLIDVGSQKIKASFDDVSKAQLFDDKKVKEAKDYRLAMDSLHDTISDLQMEMGQKLIPVIIGVSEGLAKIAGPVTTGVEKAFNALVYGIQGIATVLTAGVWGDFTEKSRQAGESVGTTSALVDDATATLLLHNRALRDTTSADYYEQNQKIMTEANNAFTKSVQAEQAAFEEMQGALDASTAKALDSQSADLKAADAVDTYTASLKDSKLSVNDHKQAFIDVQQSINDAADTYANYVVNQVKGTGQILTADDEARIRHQAQIDKLGELQKTVSPGSPLWNAIQEYIDHLKAIPTSVNTSISAKGIPNTGGTGGTSKVGMASGGPVVKGMPYWVGENGPEPFIPDQNGTIIPNNKIGSMGSIGGRGGSGWGSTVIVNQYFTVDAAADRVSVARAIEESRAALKRAGGTLVS